MPPRIFSSGFHGPKANLQNLPYPELMPHAMSHLVVFAAFLICTCGLIILGYLAMFDAPGQRVRSLLQPCWFPASSALRSHTFSGNRCLSGTRFISCLGLSPESPLGRRRRTLAGDQVKTRLDDNAASPGRADLLCPFLSHPFRSWSCTHPVEPVKEAVLAIRGTLDPNDPKHPENAYGSLTWPGRLLRSAREIN